MLNIALTSIPPRFAQLPSVMAALLAQTVATRVVLLLPKAYRRFPGAYEMPVLPAGVETLICRADYGPATKLLGAVEHGITDKIIYCDDDWLYAPNWAESLLKASTAENRAVAGSTFPVDRLKRSAPSGLDQVAQGFSGVLVSSDMFDHSVFELPPAAYTADDVWLSGHLARRRFEIDECPQARALCSPFEATGPQLQSTIINGFDRASANQACADALTDRYGIWPKRNDPT